MEQSKNGVFARSVHKKDGKKAGQVITTLFLDAESTASLISEMQSALTAQEDGVAISVVEGDGKEKRYALVGARPLEKRDFKSNKQAAAPQQVAPSTGFKPRAAGFKK